MEDGTSGYIFHFILSSGVCKEMCEEAKGAASITIYS